MAWTDIVNNVASLKDTRLTDPLLQRNFIFVDITSLTQAFLTGVISATSVDLPSYDIEIETTTPLNAPIKRSFYKTFRPGDLTITRGNFLHDLYAYNALWDLHNGSGSAFTTFPRKDFLLINYHAWKPLVKAMTMGIVGDSKNNINDTASLFFAATNMLDGLRGFLDSPLPVIAHKMKDCLLSGISLGDGFDAESQSISFNTMSFSVGKMTTKHGLNAVIEMISDL